MTERAPNIADMINAKRAAGYDGEFEALLRQPWYCPNCKASKTILDVLIPVSSGAIEACQDCGKEGIKHIGGEARKQMLAMVRAIAPFNRSGTA